MRHLFIAAAAGILTYCVALAAAQTSKASIPFVGVWKLNLAKSEPSSVQRQTTKSTVWTIDDLGGGMFKQTVKWEDSNGTIDTATQTLKCDSQDYPGTIGNGFHGLISCAETDRDTFTFTVKDQNGNPVNRYTRIMSTDGRMFEQIVKWLTPSGQSVSVLNVNGRRMTAFFDKQE